MEKRESIKMTKKKASEGSYRGQGRGPCLQESLVERDLYHLGRLDSKKTLQCLLRSVHRRGISSHTVDMQWTVMQVIPLVSLILTAIIAPLGWVIQRYWTLKGES